MLSGALTVLLGLFMLGWTLKTWNRPQRVLYDRPMFGGEFHTRFGRELSLSARRSALPVPLFLTAGGLLEMVVAARGSDVAQAICVLPALFAVLLAFINVLFNRPLWSVPPAWRSEPGLVEKMRSQAPGP